MQKILKNYGQRLHDLVNDIISIDFNTAIFNYFGIDTSFDTEKQLEDKTVKDLSDIKIDCNNVLKFLNDATHNSFYKKASESLNVLFEILEKQSEFSKEEIEKKFKDLKFITEKISDWATKIQDTKSIPDLPKSQMETYEELEMQNISTFPEETREYLLSILKPITQISLAETIRDFEERSINNNFIENLKKSVSAALKDILFKLLCFTKENSEENIYCKIESNSYFISEKEKIKNLIDENLSQNNIKDNFVNYIKNIKIMYSFDKKPYASKARYYNELKEGNSFSMIGNIIIVNLYNIFKPEDLEKYKEKGFSEEDIDSMVKSEEDRYIKTLKYNMNRNLFETSSQIHEIDHYVDFGLPYYIAREIIEKNILSEFLRKFDIKYKEYKSFLNNMDLFLSKDLNLEKVSEYSISSKNQKLVRLSEKIEKIINDSIENNSKNIQEKSDKFKEEYNNLIILKKHLNSILSYYEGYVRIIKIKRIFKKLKLDLTKENIFKKLNLFGSKEARMAFQFKRSEYPLIQYMPSDVNSLMDYTHLLLSNSLIKFQDKRKIVNLFAEAIIEQA